jgi:hypothetical protein
VWKQEDELIGEEGKKNTCSQGIQGCHKNIIASSSHETLGKEIDIQSQHCLQFFNLYYF